MRLASEAPLTSRVSSPDEQASALSEALSVLQLGGPEASQTLTEIFAAVSGGPFAAAGTSQTDSERLSETLSRELPILVRLGWLLVEPPPPLGSLSDDRVPPPELLDDLPPAEEPQEDTTFISFELKDQNRAPVPDRRFRVELPDGSVRQGFTDAFGFGSVSGIPKDGKAKITFPDFDATDFDFRKALPGQRVFNPSGPAIPIVANATRTEEGEQSFYAVRVVDQSGVALDSIGLLISADGAPHTPQTAAGGKARVDGVSVGSANVGLADPDGVRALLRKRGLAPNGAPPQGGKVRVLVPFADADPASIDSGSEHTLVVALPPRRVAVVEVDDGMFRLDSAVVLPEAESPSADQHESLTTFGIFAAAIAYAAANPNKQLLVAGHTDTSGTESHNQPLSEERAECIALCLEGSTQPTNRKRFGTLCDKRHKVSDYKQVLSWAAQRFGFSCQPAKIDDVVATGVEPIKAFQRDYNANRAALGVGSNPSLQVNGSMNPQTWSAVFDCYEAALAEELSDADDVDGRLAELAEFRKKLAFVDSSKKSQGFGEKFPIDQIGRENFRSQTNRRAELLFFDPGDEPDLSVSPEESEIYLPGNFVREHIDPETPADVLEVRIFDVLGRPLAGSQVTLTVAQQTESGTTGSDGVFTAFLPTGHDEVLVEWTDSTNSDPPKKFSQKAFVNVGARDDASATTDQSSRRLHNLGYLADKRSTQIDSFRADFGFLEDVSDAQILSDANDWHDGGEPPARGERIASNQVFPPPEEGEGGGEAQEGEATA